MSLELIRIMAPQLPSRSDFSDYLEQIDANQIYSNFGPLVKKLENELSSYLGIDPRLVVSCANATLGLEGLFSTSLVSSDETWETPSWTFAATNLAAMRSGAKIQFVDVRDDGRVVPSENCKNLIDVLPFGDGPDCARYPDGTQVCIIDAAASFDAVRNFQFPAGKKIAVVVSMHATKLMPAAGEGGFVFSNNEEWMDRFRKWSNFGFNSNRESEIIGTNAKMSEYSAAIGLASLANWNLDRGKWLELASLAQEITEKHGFLIQPSVERGFVSPYWIVDTRDAETTSSLEKSCAKASIETRRWWQYGNHLMSAFDGVPRGDLSNTERISSNLLALPLHLGLTLSDFERIDSAFKHIKNK
jgi:dTDP-4-amino-4,6-dideoxygalactose transaminase